MFKKSWNIYIIDNDCTKRKESVLPQSAIMFFPVKELMNDQGKQFGFIKGDEAFDIPPLVWMKSICDEFWKYDHLEGKEIQIQFSIKLCSLLYFEYEWKLTNQVCMLVWLSPGLMSQEMSAFVSWDFIAVTNLSKSALMSLPLSGPPRCWDLP